MADRQTAGGFDGRHSLRAAGAEGGAESGIRPTARGGRLAPLALLAGYAAVLLAAHAARGRLDPFGTVENDVQVVSVAGRFLPLGSLAYLLLAAAAVSFYVLSVAAAARFSSRLVWGGWLLFAAILLATPTLMSLDLYSYVVRGRVLWVHHANPYLHPAAEFAGDPFLRYAAPFWNAAPQNYGPLETGLSALLAGVGGDRPVVVFLVFRLWSLLGLAVATWLVAGITRPLPEAARRRALILFAWNPLVLLEFANHGHNDVWMIALGLAAWRLREAGREAGAAVCLTLAGLIKYVFWLLLPLFFLDALRRRALPWRRAVAMAALCAGVVWLFYAPFWQGTTTFSGLVAQSPLRRPFYQYGPTLLAGGLLLGPGRVLPEPVGFARTVLAGILLASQIAFAAILVWQAASRSLLARRCSVTLLAFAMLGSGTVLPWYATWWLPFLLIEGRWRAVIFWTAVGLGAYGLFYSTSLSLALGGLPLAIRSMRGRLRSGFRQKERSDSPCLSAPR
jgi:hypothetical protein